MGVSRFLSKSRRAIDTMLLKARVSYSQAGEDLVVQYLFDRLNIKQPVYLDIGTNHPKICNNTYLFYTKGARGVCVEPDVALIGDIRKVRPEDQLLHMGIGVNGTGQQPFYYFPGAYKGWNTFSKQEADARTTESGIPYQVTGVKCMSVNDILEQYFTTTPHFISLDVEGLDLPILQSLDFNRYRPDVICVETIPFSMQLKADKIASIPDLLHANGYITYADTHINTIFCKKEILDVD
jgi:FkbM family methyltransferase